MADDPFLQSMTFASHDFGGCDCDECGIPSLPLPILQAVKKRKREQLESMPMRRSQVRTLVKRSPNGVAVWDWLVPPNSQSLVEFGDSHRLLWIRKMPSGTKLQFIGQGIIGSRDEENTRVDLDWQEGDLVLLPSRAGKAVGWVPAPTATDSDGGAIVMRVAKFPVEKMNLVKFEGDDEVPLPTWVSTLWDHCKQGLEKAPDSGNAANANDDIAKTCVKFTVSKSRESITSALHEADEGATSVSTTGSDE